MIPNEKKTEIAGRLYKQITKLMDEDQDMLVILRMDAFEVLNMVHYELCKRARGDTHSGVSKP